MVVADSGVWIDFFRGTVDATTDELARLLHSADVHLVVPDVVLFEVLRGFREERDFRHARELLTSVGVAVTGGEAFALAAAGHYRALRRSGISARSAIGVLVATFCIEHDFLLLHRDRDFAAFEAARGLRVWRH